MRLMSRAAVANEKGLLPAFREATSSSPCLLRGASFWSNPRRTVAGGRASSRAGRMAAAAAGWSVPTVAASPPSCLSSFSGLWRPPPSSCAPSNSPATRSNQFPIRNSEVDRQDGQSWLDPRSAFRVQRLRPSVFRRRFRLCLPTLCVAKTKIEIPKSARSRLGKCSPSDSLRLMSSPRHAVHRAPRDSPVRFPSLRPSIPPRAHRALPREASHTRFLVGAGPQPSSAPWHRGAHPFPYLRNPFPLCSSQKPQPHFQKFPKFPSAFRSISPKTRLHSAPRSAFRVARSFPTRLICPKTHPAKSPKSPV